MPPDSPNRFLTAPVRAVRSFKRHSHSVSYQEPVRRPLRPHGPHRLLGSLGSPGPLGPSGPLRSLGPPGPLK